MIKSTMWLSRVGAAFTLGLLVAACSPPIPVPTTVPPGPPVGCYDAAGPGGIGDLLITAPLGIHGNTGVMNNSYNGKCDGVVTPDNIGTLGRGSTAQVACDAALGAGNWSGALAGDRWDTPIRLTDYWVCYQ